VLNAKAEAFYRRHGVERIERAAESGLDLTGRRVMTTRYCIREQLGLCGAGVAEPLTLIDDEGRRLELRFDCDRCAMEVYSP
jgi:putative protease